MKRHAAPWILLILLATGCSSAVPPASPSPAAATGATGTPDAGTPLATLPGRPTVTPATTNAGGTSRPETETASPEASPTPSAGDTSWLPADITTDVDALLGAASHEGAVAAARSILEKAGVVITDDETPVQQTPAAVFLSSLELDQIASEASDATGTSHTTFTDFATTFGGMAALPPNDALLDQYAGLDLAAGAAGPSPAPSPTPDPATLEDERTNLDLNPLPAKLSAFLNIWTALAIQYHGAGEPELVQLTNAPLYLAALAEHQFQPMDLRQPFASDDLRLGMLQVTLLVAGMRAPLAYAQAGILTGGTRLPIAQLLPGPMASGSAAATVGSAGGSFSDCDELKHLIDAKVPISTVVGIEGKAFIKDMIKGFMDGLLGEGNALTKAVGPAFSALSLLFKIAALVMLYEHAEAKLEIKPAFMHKPTGSNGSAKAVLKAGIPDSEWERAKQERENDFWGTALRTCARLLGVPVTKDLVDVGEGVKNWVAQWEITKGLGTDVMLREGALSGHGVVASRLERPLTKLNDHQGTDELPIDVLTEKESNHPGTEFSDPVTVCAHVVPREPPGGFKTILSAGFAGASIASSAVSGLFSLAGVIGELLTQWYREVSTIDACASMNVTYHVPVPGKWHGKITINWESHDRKAGSQVLHRGRGTGAHGEPATSRYADEMNVDVTENIYVGGSEDNFEPTSAFLQGQAYLHGAATYHRDEFSDRYTSFCHVQETYFENGGGGWSGDGSANTVIQLNPDGKYRISANADIQGLDDVNFPTDVSHTIAILDGGCDPVSENDPGAIFPTVLPREDTIDGAIDPLNPGSRLAGSQTTQWEDGSVTVITWDLEHDGPIRLTNG